MAIPCAVLMCHAPIVIPQIAGSRARDCAKTTQAMSEVARRLVAHAPDVVVIISPHTPRDVHRFGVVRDAMLTGDFGQFGAPEVGIRLPGAPAAAETLRRCAARHGIETWSPSGAHLDHGAMVPLHFLVEVGFTGPTLLLALPYPNTGTETHMGRAIAEAASELGQRFAILASGDMSHRLTRDAPAGYHPRAREFDNRFVDLITRGDFKAAAEIDPSLRELAAEDVVDSCVVATAAVGFDPQGHRVVSYEGPFGVGYLEAVLHEAPPTKRPPSEQSDDGDPPQALLSVARQAIAAHLRHQRTTLPTLGPPWDRPRGVFVTLRTPDGQLRGCIGHLGPTCASLSEEVAQCAISSAIDDSRFEPVTAQELDQLAIEISILAPPEPISGVHELDPMRYGVIVSCHARRGVLLPNIEGINSAEEQVRIATAKAGLSLGDPLRFERFEVLKLAEPVARRT
jgi:AmmeMemoRadiSam system protein A